MSVYMAMYNYVSLSQLLICSYTYILGLWLVSVSIDEDASDKTIKSEIIVVYWIDEKSVHELFHNHTTITFLKNLVPILISEL